MRPLDQITQYLVKLALWEDIGSGDITSLLTVPPDSIGRAQVRPRTQTVLSGLEVFREVFRQLDPEVRVDFLAKDGDILAKGQPAVEISGLSQSLLTGERAALNFLMHLSGIATFTRTMVTAMGGMGPKLLDTRKTMPGMRLLEKQAVVHGGGYNHRFGLFDSILIKDNHIQAGSSLVDAVKAAKKNGPNGLKVEVETENLVQVQEALKAGADILLLDNMSPEMLRQAVKLTEKFFDPRPRTVILEASGGINLLTISQVAQTGVDFISVGAVTHSAPAADLGLDWL